MLNYLLHISKQILHTLLNVVVNIHWNQYLVQNAILSISKLVMITQFLLLNSE